MRFEGLRKSTEIYIISASSSHSQLATVYNLKNNTWHYLCTLYSYKVCYPYGVRILQSLHNVVCHFRPNISKLINFYYSGYDFARITRIFTAALNLTYLIVFDFGVLNWLGKRWHAGNIVSESSGECPELKSTSE